MIFRLATAAYIAATIALLAICVSKILFGGKVTKLQLGMIFLWPISLCSKEGRDMLKATMKGL